MMKNFLNKNARALAAVFTSIASVVLSYFASLLYDKTSEILSYFKTLNNENGLSDGMFSFIEKLFPLAYLVIVIMLLSVIVFLGYKLLEKLIVKLWPEKEYNLLTQDAFIKLKDMIAKRQEVLQEQNSDYNDISLIGENIRLSISSCYNFFESAFSSTGQLVNEIKFETTFMTKSYKDGHITIPYSSNKEHRSPHSMLLRNDNINIYDQTETAKIYDKFTNKETPKMVLIPDTSEENEYVEVYENQKNRIKSTVILPIMSHKNELLGTIVVHCNKANFFDKKKYEFWYEILEIFAVDIGYQKLALDSAVDKLSDKQEPPF